MTIGHIDYRFIDLKTVAGKYLGGICKDRGYLETLNTMSFDLELFPSCVVMIDAHGALEDLLSETEVLGLT